MDLLAWFLILGFGSEQQRNDCGFSRPF